MAYTVGVSFDNFRAEKVDLLREDVQNARRSRDYLESQLTNLAANNTDFPRLGNGYVPFGSFARSTKVRPLDDIDMMVLLDGRDTRVETFYNHSCLLRITQSSSPCVTFQDDQGYVSSRRILNRIRDNLRTVHNYEKAELKVNQEAVVLKLKSYDWAFDIVPSFAVVNSGEAETLYYLIPDGNGHWKKTDPRKDREIVTAVNKTHQKLFLPLVRLIKYWNFFSRNAPRLSSYHLETLLVNGFRFQNPINSVRQGIPSAFGELATRVIIKCPDPKQLGPDLDANISWDIKIRVRDAAYSMANFANTALEFERRDEHKKAIETWQSIFPGFPKYGDNL